jgi:hypothetical protein
MALTEPQIQRYARQLLLRGFGGAAQERLLQSPVVVLGESMAAHVAASYLAIGGTPIVGLAAPSAFFAGASVAQVNADADSAHPAVLALVCAPLDPHAALPSIWVGRARVEVLPAGASRPRHAPALEAPPVLLGAAAAHLAQRWLLGEHAPAFADWFDGMFRWG